MWEYNGNGWIELIKFTNGYPVKNFDEYKKMYCMVVHQLRKDKEELQIKSALDNIENDRLLYESVEQINIILGSSFILESNNGNIRDIISQVHIIITDINHQLYPQDESVRDSISQILSQITEFIMQGSTTIKQVRYLLSFTYTLINDTFIPLFGEQRALLNLLAEIDKFKRRVSITVDQAWDFWRQAYAICSGLVSSYPLYDMGKGNFFVRDPNPPECEQIKDEETGKTYSDCDCESAAIFDIGIVEIFHKPSELLDFVPSLDRDFIIHADKWSRDFGKTWSEWDNCIGPCEGCKANAIDMVEKLDPIKIGDYQENIWDNQSGLWIWEHKIVDNATTVIGSNDVWSTLNEWWYTLWSLKVPKEFYDEKDQWIMETKNSTLRQERASYFYGSSDYNDGIWYLMSIGGILTKEIRDNINAGPDMDYKDFYITLDPPPNMLRDNTRRILDLENRIQSILQEITQLNNRIRTLEVEIQSTPRMADKERLQQELANAQVRLNDDNNIYEGLKAFKLELAESALYHEEYPFDIIAVS